MTARPDRMGRVMPPPSLRSGDVITLPMRSSITCYDFTLTQKERATHLRRAFTMTDLSVHDGPI